MTAQAALNDNGNTSREEYAHKMMRVGSERLLAALQGREWNRPKRKDRRVRDFIFIDLPEPTPEPLPENPFLERHRLSHAVADTVADAFGLTGHALRSKVRSRTHVYPRAIAMKLLREWGLPYPEIGRRFGNRDHSTVIHACEQTFPVVMRDRGAKAIYQHHRHMMAKARAQ